MPRRTFGSIRWVEARGGYLVRVSAGYTSDGKQAQPSRLVHGSYADAERVLIELAAETLSGGLPLTGKLTFGDYLLEQWLPHKAGQRRSPTHLYSMERKIRRYVIPYLGRIQLKKISPATLDRWLFRLRSDGGMKGSLSEQTILNVFSIVRASLRQAVKWEMIRNDPTAPIERPRAKKYRARTPNREEAMVMLAAFRTYPLDVGIALGIGGGLRRSEMVGLKWEDLDPGQGTVTVSRGIQRVPGKGIVVTEAKTEESRRTYHLPAFALEILKEHRKRQLASRLASEKWKDEGWIFTNPQGGVIHETTLTRHFRRALDSLGLKGMRLHDMRHAFVRLGRQAGVALDVMSKRAGHSTVRVTADVYRALDENEDKEAARLMDEFLSIKGRDI